ncbi:copper resistance protein NlpE [Sphingobacterium spiritivorum]|uniref:copper resistance protein NlpE n=1 Tax=Sphingobacterium spiritivorum TaxID=258 RepID=UPI00368312A3
MKKLILSITGAALVLISCQNASTTTTSEKSDSIAALVKKDSAGEFSNPDSAHNSQNALDWDGEYEGVLPCADCEGIKTNVILHKDNTYSLVSEYLGKKSTFKEEGKFTWDDSGSVVTLKLKDGTNKFKVQEGSLKMLDQEGNVITGSLEANYILKKV